MIIYLVRHGQKLTNPHDPQLTELGKQQAKETAKFFSDKKIDLLVASPYQRTLETAQPIAQKLKLEIIQDERLKERAEWTDEISFEKFAQIWIKSSVNRNWQPPIGDSSFNAGNRIKAVIDKYLQQNFALITHGGVIVDFLRNLTTDQYLINHYFQNLDNLNYCNVPNCSITTIEKTGRNFQIKELFSTAHLSQETH